jgi:hypothetical protein
MQPCMLPTSTHLLRDAVSLASIIPAEYLLQGNAGAMVPPRVHRTRRSCRNLLRYNYLIPTDENLC